MSLLHTIYSDTNIKRQSDVTVTTGNELIRSVNKEKIFNIQIYIRINILLTPSDSLLYTIYSDIKASRPV